MQRVAVVSGASGSIGGAVARLLAGEGGCRVLALGRDPAKLEAACGMPNCILLAGDFADPATFRRLEALMHPRVDILVNCSGGHEIAPWSATSPAQFRAMLENNLLAAHEVTQRALRFGLQDIVFVNSSQGIAASPRVGAYAAAKHGLKAYADSLRAELNPEVRVLSVYPGRTAGALQERLFELERRSYRAADLLQPDDVARILWGALQLPRTAEVTDIHIRPRLKT